jgi:predicted transcriptional regulator
MATQTEQRSLVTAWIDPMHRERLLRLAQASDRSLSAELRRAVANYLANVDQKAA